MPFSHLRYKNIGLVTPHIQKWPQFFFARVLAEQTPQSADLNIQINRKKHKQTV